MTLLVASSKIHMPNNPIISSIGKFIFSEIFKFNKTPPLSTS